MAKTFKHQARFADDDSLDLKTARKLEKSKNKRNDFRCSHCRAMIPGLAPGSSHRNHCPTCLWSKHVDSSVGSRLGSAICGGNMQPLEVEIRNDGEIGIIHSCVSCHKESSNRIAADDSLDALLGLASNDQTLADAVLLSYYGVGGVPHRD